MSRAADLVPATLAALVLAAGSAAAQTPIFSDRTAESELAFRHFNGMSGELYFVEMVGSGAAWVDYDYDGDLDAYLVQGAMLGEKDVAAAVLPPPSPLPLSDTLLRSDWERLPDGSTRHRFVDVTRRSGIDARGYGMGVAAGDLDNDGAVDLYLTNFGSNQLLRNNADGTFGDVTASSEGADDGRWSVSAAILDFDRDGWLDVYVGNFVDFRLATHKKCSALSGAHDYCGPLAYRPEADRLLHNRGDGTFADVSTSAGIDRALGGALGVIAADFNGDAWPDLYVANDGMPNLLWINRHDRTFSNEALIAGCAVNEQGLPEASMGVVAGDVNGDGAEDLFMTHLAEETNTLYLNDGTGMYRDATRVAGLGPLSWRFTGFGAVLTDVDNDGWLDLVVANGAVKRIESQLRAGDLHPLRQSNQLFRNLGGNDFEDLSGEAGEAFRVAEVSRGLASGDYDNDGDVDLLVTNNGGPARLLENQGGQGRPWLGLRLVERLGGRDMVGTRVAVTAGESSLWRRVDTGGSYASAVDPRLTVGLGSGAGKPSVRAVWPTGRVQEWRDLPLDRYITLVGGGFGATE